MRLLLDTHTLLWALAEPQDLSRRSAALLEDEENIALVSAASAWEIATKVRVGKLPQAVEIERDFLKHMQDAGYQLLAITTEIALRAGRLPGEHRDPFDRILAAHALAEDMPIVSADAKLDGFGVRRVW